MAIRGASKSTTLTVFALDSIPGLTLTPSNLETTRWLSVGQASLQKGEPIPPTGLDDQQVIAFDFQLTRTENNQEFVDSYPVHFYDVAGALTEVENLERRKDDMLFKAKLSEYIERLKSSDSLFIVVDRSEHSNESRQQVFSYQYLLGEIKQAKLNRDTFPPIAIMFSKWDLVRGKQPLGTPEQEQKKLDEFIARPENSDLQRLIRTARDVACAVMVAPISAIQGGIGADGKFKVTSLKPFNTLAPIKWALPITDQLTWRRLKEKWNHQGFSMSEWPEANASDMSSPMSPKLEPGTLLAARSISALKERRDLANRAYVQLGSRHRIATTKVKPLLDRVQSILTYKSRLRTLTVTTAACLAVVVGLVYEELDARGRFSRLATQPTMASYKSIVGALNWYKLRGSINPVSYLTTFGSNAETETQDVLRMLEKQVANEYTSRHPVENRPDQDGYIRNAWIKHCQQQLAAPWLLLDAVVDNENASKRWEACQRVESLVQFTLQLAESGNTKTMKDSLASLDLSLETFANAEKVSELKRAKTQLLAAIAVGDYRDRFQQITVLPETAANEIVEKLHQLQDLRQTTPSHYLAEVDAETARLNRVEAALQRSLLAELQNSQRFLEAKELIETFRDGTVWSESARQICRMQCDEAWDRSIWKKIEISRDKMVAAPNELRLSEVNELVDEYINIRGIENKRMLFAAHQWKAFWKRLNEPQEIALKVRSVFLPTDSELLAGWVDDRYQYPKVSISVGAKSLTNRTTSRYATKGIQFNADYDLGKIQVDRILGQKCTVSLSCYDQSWDTSVSKSIALIELLQDVAIREKSSLPHKVIFDCGELKLPQLVDYIRSEDTPYESLAGNGGSNP